MRIVVGVVVAIIALAIVLIVLDASSSNGIVSTIREWASTLSSPFHGIFHTSSHKGTIALNYGLAIVVYLAIAWLIEAVLSSTWLSSRRRALPY